MCADLFQHVQAFTSLVRQLMKKAAKDKRYGQVKEDDSSSCDHSASAGHALGGHWDNMVAQTYPPNAVIRNQPTSHTPKRKVNSNSIPQPRKLCCCC